MTIGTTYAEFLDKGTDKLQAAGITSARLDILILLEDVVGTDRAHILAHPDALIKRADIAKLNNFITQRLEHVPLAYIRGQAPFFGRSFAVTSATLVPRPETESMITLLLEIPFTAPPRIADIGTGSGCLGITAGLELPGAKIFMYDTSKAALQVAASNAQRHKLGVHLRLQDLLADDPEHYDVLLANLPYVPTNYPINQAAGHEPPEALFSGADGLDHYVRFWRQLKTAENRPQHVITESLPTQHPALAHLARAAGYAQEKSAGYAQYFTAL